MSIPPHSRIRSSYQPQKASALLVVVIPLLRFSIWLYTANYYRSLAFFIALLLASFGLGYRAMIALGRDAREATALLLLFAWNPQPNSPQY